MIKFTDEKYNWNFSSLVEFINEGNIPQDWEDFFLSDEIKTELEHISYKIRQDESIIFPSIENVFRAFYKVPLYKIKAVVIGMDPYHNGSATGLCFSVKHGNSINPSLRNIYKELKMEGYDVKEDGDLSHWADQGVLMLNMALTVQQSKPGSHSKIWLDFSLKLIKYISNNIPDVKWLLFGRDAQRITYLLKENSYFCTSHCSPFSANNKCGTHPAFIGSGVFKNVPCINW